MYAYCTAYILQNSAMQVCDRRCEVNVVHCDNKCHCKTNERLNVYSLNCEIKGLNYISILYFVAASINLTNEIDFGLLTENKCRFHYGYLYLPCDTGDGYC
jgi:hypothetical protein